MYNEDKATNNRPKSKNNPQGKPKAVKVGWREYDKHRRTKRLDRGRWMSNMVDKACELPGMEKGVHDRSV